MTAPERPSCEGRPSPVQKFALRRFTTRLFFGVGLPPLDFGPFFIRQNYFRSGGAPEGTPRFSLGAVVNPSDHMITSRPCHPVGRLSKRSTPSMQKHPRRTGPVFAAPGKGRPPLRHMHMSSSVIYYKNNISAPHTISPPLKPFKTSL